jgi:hypothetical protein
MTGEPFSGAVEQLEEKITAVGYPETEIVDLTPSQPAESADSQADSESGTEDEEPPRILGIFVEVPAGPDFRIIAQEDVEYFRIQVTYQLWQDIATQMDTETAEDLVDIPDDESVPEDHPIRELVPVDDLEITADERLVMLGAVNLLAEMKEETRAELIYHLTDLFTASELKHRVDTLSNHQGITSFQVYDKIFAYEPLSLHDLSRTIERVRMAAHRATLFLRYAFNLGVDIERTQSGTVNDQPTVEDNRSVDISTESQVTFE